MKTSIACIIAMLLLLSGKAFAYDVSDFFEETSHYNSSLHEDCFKFLMSEIDIEALTNKLNKELDARLDGREVAKVGFIRCVGNIAQQDAENLLELYLEQDRQRTKFTK